MNIALVSIYLFIATLELCAGFPFIISSMSTVPKRLVKYHHSSGRSAPPFRQFKRASTATALLSGLPFRPPTPAITAGRPKFDSISVLSEPQQRIEQKQLKSSVAAAGGEASDLHPIYVLPPPNFQPIVYPTSRADGVPAGAKIVSNKDLTITLPATRTFPYHYPHGVSSWMFGGLTGIQRGSFWEGLSSDQALHNPIRTAAQPNRIVVYVKRIIPGQPPAWPAIPTIEAHSVVANTAAVAIDDNQPPERRIIRTKLPVGLSSFFLGGMRGVSGRHWQMPADLVEQIEFMPKDGEEGKALSDADKKSVEYKPAVQFDDEAELYNIIKLD